MCFFFCFFQGGFRNCFEEVFCFLFWSCWFVVGLVCGGFGRWTTPEALVVAHGAS